MREAIARRNFIVLGGAAIALMSLPVGWARAARASPLHIQGARWFDGRSFTPREAWVVDGRLTFSAPVADAETLDLSGTFLTPPFADAHSHSFGEGRPEWDARNAARYLSDGVFYVMSQGNLPLGPAEKSTLALGTPRGVDVAWSNGTILAHGSSVRALFETVVMPRGAFPGYTVDSLDNVRFSQVDDVAELDRKWPAIRAQGSDFIKVYLQNVAEEPDDHLPPFLRGRSLSPEVLRAVIARAKSDRLRVSAHVTTGADFALAAEAGVDMIAHVPDGPLTTEAIAMAAEKAISIVTTVAFRARQSPPPAVAVILDNLRMLVAGGARIVIGADTPADTTAQEVDYLRTTGLWDDAALLSLWAVATPRSIFPDRRIGVFEDGAEASFLALSADPMADWSATKQIRLRMKQGIVLGEMPG